MKFTHFRCPLCKEVSTAGEWNARTLRHATEHKIKKLRVKIQDAGNAAHLGYVCPNCSMFVTKNRIAAVLTKEAVHV